MINKMFSDEVYGYIIKKHGAKFAELRKEYAESPFYYGLTEVLEDLEKQNLITIFRYSIKGYGIYDGHYSFFYPKDM